MTDRERELLERVRAEDRARPMRWFGADAATFAALYRLADAGRIIVADAKNGVTVEAVR